MLCAYVLQKSDKAIRNDHKLTALSKLCDLENSNEIRVDRRFGWLFDGRECHSSARTVERMPKWTTLRYEAAKVREARRLI
jgi:hypothetical protein